jgi:hypothetical protein
VVCWYVVCGMWHVICGYVECDMWYVDMLVCDMWYVVSRYGYVIYM